MKRALLCLLLLFSALILQAAEPDYPDLIRKTRRYLTVFPDDGLERLNLAWYHMQNAQPDSALVHYDKILDTDPSHELAAAGGLWACNSLTRYRETLRRADNYLLLWPQNPDILNHRALAHLYLFSPLKARNDYAEAKKHSNPESLSKAIANDGLAWSYLNLADYASASRYVKTNPPASQYTLLPWLEKTRFGASLGMGRKSGGDTYYLFGASVAKKTISLAVSGEEYRWQGEHYRTALKLDFEKQFTPLDLKLSCQSLSDTDERVYPAWQAGFSAQGKVHASSYLIRPLFSAYYAYHPSFSNLQADFGLWAGNDLVKLQFIYSGLYQDNEAINSDLWGKVLSLGADLRIWRGIHLSLNASQGDMAWWTNPHGIMIDTFYPNQEIYGLGLLLPLGHTIGLSLYQQMGVIDASRNYLTQGTLYLAF